MVFERATQWFFSALSRPSDYQGRAGRFEAISFVVGQMLACGVCALIGASIGLAWQLAAVWLCVSAAPALMLLIRRAHDAGKSGWWGLWSLFPPIGFLVLISSSDAEPNQWGYTERLTADEADAHPKRLPPDERAIENFAPNNTDSKEEVIHGKEN